MATTPAALAPAQAAEYLGIGRTLVYDLIRSGELPTVKIGRRTVLRTLDLDAFLAERVA